MRPKAPAAVLLAFVLFALLAGHPQAQTQSFSSFYCSITGTTTDLGSCIMGAVPISLIGIALSFAIVGIAYMLGNVLRINSLRNWYMNELKETVKSIIIVMSVFSVLAILSGVTVSFIANGAPAAGTGGANQAPSTLATNVQAMYTAINDQYLTPELNTAQQTFYLLFGMYNGISFLKSLTLSVYFPIPVIPVYTVGSLDFGVDEPVYTSSIVTSLTEPGLSFLSNAGKLIVVPVYMILQVQKDILYYVIVAGLGLLLPIGIVLRAIPFLRSIGGTLIALGIGVSLVYPALLLLINLPISTYMTPALTPPAGQQPHIVCPNGMSTLMCKLFKAAFNMITPSFRSQAWNGEQVNFGFFFALQSFVSIYPILNGLLSMAFINLVLQFLLFVIDIVVGIVIVQDIGNILGGRVKFGVGKLKLA